LNQEAGHEDIAKKAYEKALEIAPGSGGAANNLAWLYMKGDSKDLDKALELARAAKIALPQAAPVSDTLGWVYYNRKLYESALPLLQEAIKQQPDKAEYHFHLAAVLLEQGKKPQAKAEMSTALKLDANLKNRDEVKKVMGALGV
jgi:tetratricopeptide (TPR) repeat protein